MQKKIQLTKEGFEKIQAELLELKTKRRPTAIDALQKARAMGDLSENTAYSSAKDELALVEGRIQEIEQIEKNAEVVVNRNNTGRVSLGSRVIVKTNGNQEEFQIVGEFEADPLNKKLSSTSPLGQGFLSKQVGDQVEIQVPAGKVVYDIIEIK